MTCPGASIRLCNLPLRPSTLSLLTRRGFVTAQDVFQSCGVHRSFSDRNLPKNDAKYHITCTNKVPTTTLKIIRNRYEEDGSISSFANELEINITEAAVILNEVDTVLRTLTDSVSSLSQKNNENSVTTGSTSSHDRISPPTAASILKSALHGGNSTTPAAPNATGSWSPLRPIVSFVQSIDTMLGGGFFPREITELVGPPGTGKTQLAMQLCVDARLPREFGGVAGGAVYIDTEGSFSPERCWDMAEALVQHVHDSAKRSAVIPTTSTHNKNSSTNSNPQKPYPKTVPSWFTSENILEGIQVFRVHDESSLTATILSLPNYIQKYQEDFGIPVKIVIVDSIAFHFRCISSDYKTRTRSLLTLVHNLADMANNFDISVVAINQMTTKVSTSADSVEGTPSVTSNKSSWVQYPSTSSSMSSTTEDGESKLIPALGPSFAHSTTTRLLLKNDPSFHSTVEENHANKSGRRIHPLPRRICKLIKSPHKPMATAYFCVTEYGVRDWSKLLLPQHVSSRNEDSNITRDGLSNSQKRIKTSNH